MRAALAANSARNDGCDPAGGKRRLQNQSDFLREEVLRRSVETLRGDAGERSSGPRNGAFCALLYDERGCEERYSGRCAARSTGRAVRGPGRFALIRVVVAGGRFCAVSMRVDLVIMLVARVLRFMTAQCHAQSTDRRRQPLQGNSQHQRHRDQPAEQFERHRGRFYARRHLGSGPFFSWLAQR